MSERSFLQMTFKAIILPAAILGLAIAIFMYMKNSKSEVAAKPMAEESWTVSTYPITLINAAPLVTLYGSVEAGESVQLSATVSAYVADVLVAKGDSVKQDEKLVVLDDRDLKFVLKQRQASLKDINARIASEKNRFQTDSKSFVIEQQLQELNIKNLNRQQELVANNMAPTSLLDDANKIVQQQQISLLSRQSNLNDHPNRLAQLEAQKTQTETQLAITKLDLKRTQIMAPFTGRVLSVDTAAGNRVRNGDRMVRMYNTENLEVRSQVPARYLSAVRNGTNISATMAYNDQTLALPLDRLSAEATGSQGGVDAFFRIYSGVNIEIGRNVTLTLALAEQRNVAAIPALALFGQDTIYRVNNERLQAIAVERIGETRDAKGNNLTLVRSESLQQGDVIITTRLPNAITGLKVEAR